MDFSGSYRPEKAHKTGVSNALAVKPSSNQAFDKNGFWMDFWTLEGYWRDAGWYWTCKIRVNRTINSNRTPAIDKNLIWRCNIYNRNQSLVSSKIIYGGDGTPPYGATPIYKDLLKKNEEVKDEYERILKNIASSEVPKALIEHRGEKYQYYVEKYEAIFENE